MIDLSETLDIGTSFPETWKTLVREILLKFEDGAVYHHENIAGSRPYTVDLVIKIDDPVDDETYEKLQKESQDKAEQNKHIEELILEINKLTADDLEISLEKILSLLKNNTTAVADE
ncbi:MAG: hypothetical protein IJF83_03110 [Methanobrevibacter sp.]|nr:hypothetical protein [Methanobrevibacter sp.]